MNERKHILVLDSDAAVRDLMLEYLDGVGYKVCAQADLDGALEYMRDNPAPVILADMHLVNVRDLRPLKELLRLRPGARVILIAGTVNLNSILKSFRHGAFDLIIKPIQLPNLLESIEKAFAEYDASPVERRLRRRIAELESELEKSNNMPETADTLEDNGLLHGMAAD